jgi:hypothetical protein
MWKLKKKDCKVEEALLRKMKWTWPGWRIGMEEGEGKILREGSREGGHNQSTM